MPVCRPATPEDRAQLQSWDALRPFLNDEVSVIVMESGVAAALAWRSLAPGEREILYLETAPYARRRGLAQALLQSLLTGFSGTIYLEVRASNNAALTLYCKLGFEPYGTRKNYYENPPESAIVLKFRSC